MRVVCEMSVTDLIRSADIEPTRQGVLGHDRRAATIKTGLLFATDLRHNARHLPQARLSRMSSPGSHRSSRRLGYR